MFCLRSWLPLLLIPTNSSPSFIFLFFVCTYFLNRPCVYCSLLLLILFLTSCNWSDHCFFDFSSNWFQPRALVGDTACVAANLTCAGACACASGPGPSVSSVSGSVLDSLAGSFSDEIKTAAAVVADAVGAAVPMAVSSAAQKLVGARSEWTGIGLEWLRGLLGRREWRIDCLDVYIRL